MLDDVPVERASEMDTNRNGIEQLFAEYVACLDDDRLEEWPDFFTEDCRYLVTTYDNVQASLPHATILATSKGMLKDRIYSLREANIYENHRYRHIVSSVRILDATDSGISVRSNFLVVRIMHNGDTMLFATGEYQDTVESQNGQFRFKERKVVTDSHKYDTLLAIPL